MASLSTKMVDIPDLVSQLTLEEKVLLLAGKNFWETQEIDRLSIPSLKVSDGPNGARGAEFFDGPKAACFPASVSLAASWDIDTAAQIGRALAEETITKGAHVLLAPTVCPHRHPLGGRNFESFSEDPLLAGRMSSGVIKGLQANGVGATIKHFAVNEQETRRFSMNANVDQRALREIYLKPFEIAIKEASPWAIMTSYNLVNGLHSDMNNYLLQRVLRQEWGFKGLVVSDWGGTNSVAESLNAGLSLEMPGPAMHRGKEAIQDALSAGTLTAQTIDVRVTEVLELVQKAGKFENPVTLPEQSINKPEHAKLIRNAGSAGMVLLKNEDNILPLRKENLKSVALLGFAKEALIHGGGSASVNAHYKITPFDAFEHELGEGVQLTYAKGMSHIRTGIPT